MAYQHLAIAIASEVIGTLFLKRSDGLTDTRASFIVVVAYSISFYYLSLSLKFLPTGVAYAIWSGSGIILIAGFSWIMQGQRLDAPALLGMSLIVAGLLVMHLTSKVMMH